MSANLTIWAVILVLAGIGVWLLTRPERSLEPSLTIRIVADTTGIITSLQEAREGLQRIAAAARGAQHSYGHLNAGIREAMEEQKRAQAEAFYSKWKEHGGVIAIDPVLNLGDGSTVIAAYQTSDGTIHMSDWTPRPGAEQ